MYGSSTASLDSVKVSAITCSMDAIGKAGCAVESEEGSDSLKASTAASLVAIGAVMEALDMNGYTWKME